MCQDEGKDYPLGVSVLQNSLYVDDVLFGVHNASTILAIRHQLIELLERGGFHLRKWTSNYDELLQEIPVSDRLDISDITFQNDSAVKTLGLSWNPRLDALSFQLQLPETSVFTKRTVLSLISRIFDPLGLIAPVVISAKIFMQELWLRKLDWDSPLPLDLRERWSEYYSALKSAASIRLPRWTHLEPEALGFELGSPMLPAGRMRLSFESIVRWKSFK